MKHHRIIEFKMASDNNEQDQERNAEDLTQQVLLSLVFDVTCLRENVEQVMVKVLALSRQAGVEPPKG